jgi:carbon monoxide dehydrogenase subunit G
LEFVYDRTVTASAKTVWDVLTDPEAMEPHLPGTVKVVATGSSAYRVSMKISMGFLRPTVNADVVLSNDVALQSMTIELSGKSMGAGVSGTSEVVLTPALDDDSNSTRVRMVGVVETSGLLKKVGDSKIEAAAVGFLESYFESVERAAAAI